MNYIPESELILNEDGSIYHLKLLPEDIADTVILVGDPNRVALISRYFDSIEVKKANREFVTHTGFLNKKRLSVIATGIGTDNIDIVLNELDALKNINLTDRTVKEVLTSLNLIRVGTSGSLQATIPVDTFVATEYAIGLDGLLFFYQNDNDDDDDLAIQHKVEAIAKVPAYVSKADANLLTTIADGITKGITLTATGFYAPQGRQLRLAPKQPKFVDTLSEENFSGRKITNFEMESSGIYGLGKLLGHKCLSLNAILANRVLGQFSTQHDKTVDTLIKYVLERIAYIK